MVTPYSEFTEEQKERARAACRRWKAKTDRKLYYKLYDKQRQGKRLTYKMFDAARRRTNESGLPFSIVENDILVPEKCPICDSKMQEAFGIQGGTISSPTLDKIDPLKGYVLGNIAVICKLCNSKKGNSTPSELRRIAEWIESF